MDVHESWELAVFVFTIGLLLLYSVLQYTFSGAKNLWHKIK
jgi:hypothetical protein